MVALLEVEGLQSENVTCRDCRDTAALLLGALYSSHAALTQVLYRISRLAEKRGIHQADSGVN